MLEVAVIGGGLCGLALAHSLQARGVPWALFESRHRLGGRVLSPAGAFGLAVDLGATWYWPATQPSITRLVEDLGLPSLAQPDDGQLLLLDDPNRAPALRAFDAARGRPAVAPDGPAQPGALHGGARRLAGGMGRLIEALVQRLPAARLHRGHRLLRLQDAGDHVRLLLQAEGGPPFQAQARQVVLALPPRLAASAIGFEPGLPADLSQALAATPTWMATAAKAAWRCQHAPWRAAAHRGNAWVSHPQAVLAEVFDAGPGQGPGALAGFLALDAARRQAYRRGLPLLVESQLAMLFGDAAAAGELQLHDWAEEADTCSPADRQDDARAATDPAASAHPVYGHPALARPHWGGRLWWAGGETARAGGGYLEGALGAAARVRRGLAEARAGALAG